MTLLRSGDHILCGDIIYGGSSELINNITVRAGVEATYVDTTDLTNVEKAVRPNTKVIVLINHYSLVNIV